LGFGELGRSPAFGELGFGELGFGDLGFGELGRNRLVSGLVSR